MKRTLGHRKDGSAVFATDTEIIENALQQERDGIKPHYSFYDYKNKKTITPKGWLAWSLWEGCGVVYRREDGKMVIVTGRQGEFAYVV